MVQFYKAPKKTKKSLTKETMSVTIDAVSSHGEGVCLTHIPAIFVNGGLPNETLDVEIVKKHKKHWQGKAKLKTIVEAPFSPLSPHSQRITPFCDYFQQCGGCTTQYCEPHAMLEFKQVALHKQFQKTLGVTELPWQTPIQTTRRGYRRKARLAVDARNPKSIKLGFRSAGSSNIITIPKCPILEDDLQNIMQLLHINIVGDSLTEQGGDNVINKSFINAVRHVGHITLMKVDGVCSVTVNLVKDLNTSGCNWWEELERQLSRTIDSSISVYLTQPTHTIELARGEKATIDIKHGSRTEATDFIQVNESVNTAMIEHVRNELIKDKPVSMLDLFCGLGNFTFPLSSYIPDVIGIEGSQEMVRKASAIALQSGIENIAFKCRDLNTPDGLADLLSTNVSHVLLDPSREGALAVCEQLHSRKIQKIVYISCNPQTWQRDASVLLNNGYSLSSLMLMDMFPYTPHSELFSVFTHS